MSLLQDKTSQQVIEDSLLQEIIYKSTMGDIQLHHEELIKKLERYDSLCESVASFEESSSSDETGEDAGSDSSSMCGNEKSNSSHMHDSRNARSSSVVSSGSEEGGRDSGIEDREPDMLIPDQDLIEKVVTQVEFYFSDANVVRDKFLLKHIRRNKEGFVSLKLVSSFKKVKQLTKDWRVVAHCLTKVSNSIEINEQGTKIRRTEPLPEIDDSPITCAVLVLDLPLEKPTIGSVSQLFSESGEIAFIRVLREGGPLPPDVKSFLTKYPCLGEKNCAWIEFETPEAAKAATELSTDYGMKVVLIVPESQKKQEKQKQHQMSGSSSKKNSVSSIHGKVSAYSMNSANVYPNKGINSRKNSWNKNSMGPKYRRESQSSMNGHSHDFLDRRPVAYRRKGFSLPNGHGPFNDSSAEGGRPVKPRPKSKSCVEFPSSTSPPSWVQRHLFAAAAASALSAASPTGGSSHSRVNKTPRHSVGSLTSEGIVRFPKGPDGSRGFFTREISTNSLRQINELSGTIA